MPDYDVAVIGGGVIGSAIAFGLTRLGQKTILFDEGDQAFRAARGNFGLIWVQGKGDTNPKYATWTRRSSFLWKEFNEEIENLTGINTDYSRPGGLHLCLREDDLQQRQKLLSRMAFDSEGEFQFEMLDHDAATARLPGLGPDVSGASYSPLDGHVNPLYLLRGLHASFIATGGCLKITPILDLCWCDSAVELQTVSETIHVGKVVLAAGLGIQKLASRVGLKVPVSPNRGQILVTERISPFLDFPTNWVRQTAEGSLLLGDSKEDVGFDDGISLDTMQAIAERACRIFPCLRQVRLVRAWGALRIMSPDGLPIYSQSDEFPGVFSASGHSGVTLAAAHALDFAGFVVNGTLPASLNTFSERRFHVS